MDVMRKLAILLCFVASLLPAQTVGPSVVSITGKGWVMIMTDTMKSSYVKGYQDGIEFVVAELPTEARDTMRSNLIAKGFTVADYIQELDTLFADRENWPILLPMAHLYVTLKLNGQLTKAELEQRLIDLRRL
jgi:hypothetical protein